MGAWKSETNNTGGYLLFFKVPLLSLVCIVGNQFISHCWKTGIAFPIMWLFVKFPSIINTCTALLLNSLSVSDFIIFYITFILQLEFKILLLKFFAAFITFGKILQ